MENYKTFALAAFFLAVISAFAHASAKPEFRALEVQTWVPGMLSRQEVDSTIKWAKDANFNVVILQARTVADAYYDSAYEPKSPNIKDPGFDPMAYGIKKCRENGLQVYAWFVIYRVWKGGKPSDPRHIANLHPEWLNRDYDGNPSYGDSCRFRECIKRKAGKTA